MGFRKEINRNRGSSPYAPKLVTNMRLGSKDSRDYVGVVLIGNLTNVASNKKPYPPTPGIWLPSLGETVKLKNHLLFTFGLEFSPDLKTYNNCSYFRLNTRFYFFRNSIIDKVVGNGDIASEIAWLRVCPVFLPLNQFISIGRDINYINLFSTIKDYLTDKDYVMLSLDEDRYHSIKYKTISDWINGKIPAPKSELGLFFDNDWSS